MTAAIRSYRSSDQPAVVGLFRQFMAELTPPQRRAEFDAYIETAVREELSRIEEYYFSQPGQGFWVAHLDRVVGMAGIERLADTRAELRRMAVDASHRRGGIGRQLLQTAEAFCRQSGYEEIVLSTSEFQQAAMRLYEASGYRLVGSGIAASQSHKTVGGGVVRYSYEKRLR